MTDGGCQLIQVVFLHSLSCTTSHSGTTLGSIWDSRSQTTVLPKDVTNHRNNSWVPPRVDPFYKGGGCDPGVVEVCPYVG